MRSNYNTRAYRVFQKWLSTNGEKLLYFFLLFIFFKRGGGEKQTRGVINRDKRWPPFFQPIPPPSPFSFSNENSFQRGRRALLLVDMRNTTLTCAIITQKLDVTSVSPRVSIKRRRLQHVPPPPPPPPSVVVTFAREKWRDTRSPGNAL